MFVIRMMFQLIKYTRLIESKQFQFIEQLSFVLNINKPNGT